MTTLKTAVMTAQRSPVFYAVTPSATFPCRCLGTAHSLVLAYGGWVLTHEPGAVFTPPEPPRLALAA